MSCRDNFTHSETVRVANQVARQITVGVEQQTIGLDQIAIGMADRHRKVAGELAIQSGNVPQGRDLAPRVANRLQTGLTADCTALEVCEKEGILLQTRPTYGGNIMATIVCPDNRPQMATVRPGVMEMKTTPGGKGKIIKHK